MNKLAKFSQFCLVRLPKYQYHPDKVITLRQEKSGYFLNPEDVARRLIKLIALHDDVKQPEKITLSATWYELGLNDMTYVEIMIEAEREFELEFPDDDVEKFKDVNDAVEYISRSFFAI